MATKGSVFKRCGCTYTTPEGKRKQYGQKCPKLKRPNGSYNPRHGTWAFLTAVVERGDRKQVLRSGFDSQADAQDALDKLRAKHARGVIVTERLTVKRYMSEWIAGKADLRPNTVKSYDGQIKRYINPYIGHLKLDDLRASDIADMLKHVPGSAATIQRVRACLRSALNDAIRQGFILNNPASHVKLPSGKRPKALVWTEARVAEWRTNGERPSPVMVWTPAQLGTFLDCHHTHRLYALWWLLSHRGLRRGEALGLEWADVDLDAGTAVIMRQRISVRGETFETEPKSDAGGRTIALGRDGIATLKQHRTDQLKERMSGKRWVDSGKVFTTPNGEPLDPSTITHLFRSLIEDADLPPVRLHDLRHGAASLLLAGGVSMKVVQETLGHANIATTSNTYTSVYPEVAQEAADIVSALVPRTSVRNS